MRIDGSWQAGKFIGPLQGNADTATKLSNTPNNTTTFLRGDNTWTSTLGGAFTANGTITANGGYLKSTLNSNTVTIGSQNAGFTHIYNSANIPFIFNKSVLTTAGNLGNTDYPWNNLYLGKADGAGIYYTSTNYTKKIIEFFNHSADQYGVGIKICTGGCVIIGAGESGDTIKTNIAPVSGAETTYIGSDGSIIFYPSINGWDAAAKIEMTAGKIWAGVNGNTTRENQVGVQSGSGQLYMYAQAATSANRGIYIPAHGSGAAKAVVNIDTNNRVYFADSYNGTSTALAYSQAGLAASAITWLTCWNGYELRAISKAEVAAAVKGAASGSWGISVTGSSGSCTGNAATATTASNLAAAAASFTVAGTSNGGGLKKYGQLVLCVIQCRTTSQCNTGAVLGTIPSGYRPSYAHYYQGCYGTTWIHVGVYTDGTIKPDGTIPAGSYLRMDFIYSV